MLKAFTKYRPFLFILLLSACSQLHAHKAAVIGEFVTAVYDPSLIIQAASSDSQQECYKIDVAEKEVEEDEIEDDDVDFSKKHEDHGSHSAIFFIPTLGFLNNNSKALPSVAYVSYVSSHRYLVFEVFRI
ncbi:hypothetical protein WSM22_42020 [Cytophagales bacterium WSM2-2]|nr:hypothetical protein WSM22_42020 [Cytophagales bacterium WSM2-2]